MKTVLAAIAMLAALAGAASAQTRYDRKLEEAVKARVAERIGDLRQGFGYGEPVHFVRAADALSAGAATPLPRPAAEPRRGALSLATERGNARRVF